MACGFVDAVILYKELKGLKDEQTDSYSSNIHTYNGNQPAHIGWRHRYSFVRSAGINISVIPGSDSPGPAEGGFSVFAAP
jgi:hypothetical protein